jgi:hypothetical protein
VLENYGARAVLPVGEGSGPRARCDCSTPPASSGLTFSNGNPAGRPKAVGLAGVGLLGCHNVIIALTAFAGNAVTAALFRALSFGLAFFSAACASARFNAHRFLVAAMILFMPSSLIWRLGFGVSASVIGTDLSSQRHPIRTI